MKEKIYFSEHTKKKSYDFLKENKERKNINFLDAHCVYIFNKEKDLKEVLLDKNCINFIDGFLISCALSFKNLKRVPRNRGPTFTRDFLSSPEHSSRYKHFFIGLSEFDLKKIKRKCPHLEKVSSYNPPYIKEYHFSKEEVEKMAKIINKERPDFVWMGIGSPKQNILSRELFYKTKAKYFINIGAAMDFLLEKKAEAPLWIRELGIEWFYRLIKDFKYAHKKVIRSFVAIRYLGLIDLKKDK